MSLGAIGSADTAQRARFQAVRRRVFEEMMDATTHKRLSIMLPFQPHFCDPAAALRHIAISLRAQERLVVLHLVGSEQINAFHHRVGGAVGNDMLPSAHEWPALLSKAGLWMQSLEDRTDLFLLEAVRI